ncbi:hypothetical protein CKM354_001152100 [Cercospora kikuchii]|uniref:Uncharacterized protein n=1 Tax=Cercospora kikuchii TaxID=84275 RepID=A0A9P3CSE9_9PEZI|nr:uncharacterized protein CKM354_001152100 [Cercospora kikuchii]GIZ48462.1 hypothetical protein CKM354_001152100 [Cercospora kikuchii]
MDYSNRALPVVTRTNYIREQIFANAVALFPDLVSEHARQTGTHGYVDPKEVSQILVIWSQGGWFALLGYGVPRVRHTLVEGKPKYNAEKALERLSWTISEALGMRYPSELGITGQRQRKLQDGTINRDFF